MLVTSLRVIWKSEKAKRTNLSVGLSCVVNITMRATQSRLKGNGTSPVGAPDVAGAAPQKLLTASAVVTCYTSTFT